MYIYFLSAVTFESSVAFQVFWGSHFLSSSRPIKLGDFHNDRSLSPATSIADCPALNHLSIG